ncbi:tripartite tricarboxylate transporter TctB family protein [Agrobacterium tumefaciens]|uniref:tripartite tricarboxylate transporter TctB family protein n=1 Tax=Agrobacterium tumefaciens TaxID=358 RepID=UPI0015724083|nr:tripartite tricarboxylate transporter TctB family protein [Agrobacterium tumefaciens]
MRASSIIPYVLASIGLAAASSALPLHIWAYGEPAAGLFPFLAGLLLAGTSLICARETIPSSEPVDLTRLVAYCGALAGFCLLLNWLGFALGAFLFLTAVLVFIERMNWKKGLVLAAAFSFGTWGLFDLLLSVPLPTGMWRV